MVYSSQNGFGLLSLTKIDAQLKAKVIISAENLVMGKFVFYKFKYCE